MIASKGRRRWMQESHPHPSCSSPTCCTRHPGRQDKGSRFAYTSSCPIASFIVCRPARGPLRNRYSTGGPLSCHVWSMYREPCPRSVCMCWPLALRPLVDAGALPAASISPQHMSTTLLVTCQSVEQSAISHPLAFSHTHARTQHTAALITA